VEFSTPLVRGTLRLREKRFLAHVVLDDGREVIAHTNNSGAMTGCSTPGSTVWLSPANNPKRKLKWTWELVEAVPGVLAGINTQLPNRLAEEAIAAGRIPELRGFASIRREVRYGEERSRIDVLLEDPGRCWVEVKNVTLIRDGAAAFPDAKTDRGRKHLRELAAQVVAGDRAALLFVVQRSDADRVVPADDVDPAYGAELRRAAAAGVQVLAWQADVSPAGVSLVRPLPVLLD
jgi:sugar fermentation stimulation protein A